MRSGLGTALAEDLDGAFEEVVISFQAGLYAFAVSLCGDLGRGEEIVQEALIRAYRALKTKEVGILVRPGDVFVVESGGGGGYGDPRERPAAARAYDVENELVTRRGKKR